MLLRPTVKPFRKNLISEVRAGDHKVVVTGKTKGWNLAIIRGKSAFVVKSGFPTQKKATEFSRDKYNRDAAVSRAVFTSVEPGFTPLIVS